MSAVVDALKKHGILTLPLGFDGVDAFARHLDGRPVYRNHVRQGKQVEGTLGSHPWMCHDMHDVIEAPGWFERALALIPIATKFLGTEPVLYSLNAFYCEPGAKPKPDIQDWHRDSDDRAFLAAFTYCTDVLDENDGPHQFQLGTHGGAAAGPIVSVFGRRGAMFLGATSGLHRGLVPKWRRRMIAWARFGVSDPPEAYKWDGLTPLPRERLGDRYPTNPITQRIIRLVVA